MPDWKRSLVFRGSRLFVLSVLRKEVISLAHSSHIDLGGGGGGGLIASSSRMYVLAWN